jgi:ADP-ribose pyrophosphatase
MAPKKTAKKSQSARRKMPRNPAKRVAADSSLPHKARRNSKAAATPARGAEITKGLPECAKVLSSQVIFEGPLFRVSRDKIIEPTGLRSTRDIVRHGGSAVILAVDRSKSKKNPWIVMERQYRHAANQFLWELPAGKLDPGEDPLAGAQRELAEETGYRARKWRPLVSYYASPGFVGEAMLVFLAEDLYAGEARPEEDERIELRLIKLSDLLSMIEKGTIHDGKTLNAVLLYAWLHGRKRKK